MARACVFLLTVALGVAFPIGCGSPEADRGSGSNDEAASESTAPEPQPVFSEGFEGGDVDEWQSTPEAEADETDAGDNESGRE